MGVPSAALIFLPANQAQIPWSGIKWACRLPPRREWGGTFKAREGAIKSFR